MTSTWDMSPRPEFYSGRGAIVCDLCSGHLEMIYRGVKQEYGDDAAKQFVQMVCDMPKLSATLFLQQFHAFVGRNCMWNLRDPLETNEIDVGPDDGNGGRNLGAMCALTNVLSGAVERNETEEIRTQFLLKHRDEFEGDMPRGINYGSKWVCYRPMRESR